MSNEISINFVANVREVISGTDKIENALQDTEKNLDKVGDSGKKSLDQVTKGTKDAADGAGNLAGGVSGELSNAFQSFDGTAASALESVSSGLSSLASLIPGIGGLIGAGVGVALTEGVRLFTADLDAQAKLGEERIKTMYDNFVESGNNFYNEEQIRKATQAITGDPVKLAEAQGMADALGVKVEVVIAAQVQGGEARNTVLAKAQELEEGILNLTGDEQAAKLGVYLELEKIKKSLTDQTAEQGDAGKAADIYRESVDISLGTHTKINEEIQKQNKHLAETPKTLPIKLEIDSSAIDTAVRRRTVEVDVQVYTRNGTKVY